MPRPQKPSGGYMVKGGGGKGGMGKTNDPYSGTQINPTYAQSLQNPPAFQYQDVAQPQPYLDTRSHWLGLDFMPKMGQDNASMLNGQIGFGVNQQASLAPGQIDAFTKQQNVLTEAAKQRIANELSTKLQFGPQFDQQDIQHQTGLQSALAPGIQSAFAGQQGTLTDELAKRNVNDYQTRLDYEPKMQSALAPGILSAYTGQQNVLTDALNKRGVNDYQNRIQYEPKVNFANYLAASGGDPSDPSNANLSNSRFKAGQAALTGKANAENAEYDNSKLASLARRPYVEANEVNKAQIDNETLAQKLNTIQQPDYVQANSDAMYAPLIEQINKARSSGKESVGPGDAFHIPATKIGSRDFPELYGRGQYNKTEPGVTTYFTSKGKYTDKAHIPAGETIQFESQGEPKIKGTVSPYIGSGLPDTKNTGNPSVDVINGQPVQAVKKNVATVAPTKAQQLFDLTKMNSSLSTSPDMTERLQYILQPWYTPFDDNLSIQDLRKKAASFLKH